MHGLVGKYVKNKQTKTRTIECINVEILPFCRFCDQKREFDIILIHDVSMMCFTNGAFQISSGRIYNHMQSCVMHQNNIKFSATNSIF